MKLRPIFIVMLTAVTALIALGNLVVYQALTFFFSIQSPNILLFLKTLFIIFTFNFTIFTLLTNRSYSKVISFFYTISATWLGALHLFFMASIISTIIIFISYLLGLSGSISIIIGEIILSLAGIISITSIFNANNTKITPYTISMPNLPESWHGKKIALVADVHMGNVRGIAFAQKVAALIQEQHPECVMIAGDFYDGPPVPYEEVAKPFGNIQSRYGNFFITGNHEEYRESGVYIDALKKVGIKVLQNEVVDLDGLQLIGFSYYSSIDEKVQAETLEKARFDKNRPSILMNHIPHLLSGIEKAGINLQVSGHTHYGQMWPYNLMTKRIYGEFAYGLHRFKNLQVITTSGAGTWGPPQRFLTKGEIVLITLEKTT